MVPSLDEKLVEKLLAQMRSEFSRTAPPPNFPAFHDVPSGRYTSDEFYDLERTHLWNKVWVVAGRVDDLPEEGSYFRFDELGPPLIVVRGADDTIRCFSNTCRHRGAPVVRESTGTVRHLRCQYHSWTYDIDEGALIAVPDERDFVDLCRQDRGLPRVSCDIWGGWIWVNLDPQAQPLDQFLGSVPAEMADFGPADLRLMATDHRIVNCNWKVAVDAFLEVYHLRFIHQGGNLPELDSRGAALGLLGNGNSRMVTPFSNPSAHAMGMTSWDDLTEFPSQGGVDNIAGLHPMIHSSRYSFTIFPNLVIPLGSAGFPTLLFFPIDAGTTHLRIHHYGQPGEGPAWEAAWAARVAAFAGIIDEDVENLEPMQRAMESPLYSGVPLNYQERRIWYLHETIDQVIGIERIPPELGVEQLLAPYVEADAATS
jgi:phenylpropionate dioxygenase-like ring-hydroxylating dioxygenase large terminal subunit